MGRLSPIKQFIDQSTKMSPSVFLLCFLAMGAIVHAEEEEWEVGLSAEEIMSTEFEEEYSDDERSIDEIIEAAGTESGAKEDAANNQAINFDMDMQMEPMQYAMEYGNAQGFAGAGMANDWYRWPKNIIPYKIQSGHFSSSQMQIIYAGMKMWMEKTCIRFTPAGSSLARSTGHSHYIRIFSGRGCYSYVGYTHRTHDVSLQARGCLLKGIVAHELGHTIGLHHEQCRADRDQHLKVVFSNVPSSKRNNFEKSRGVSTFGQPYDYCSLMHYGRTAFGGGKFTMIPHDLDYLGTIGRSHDRNAPLTQTDANIVNKMYKCGINAAPTSCPKIGCSRLYSSSTCSSLSRMIRG